MFDIMFMTRDEEARFEEAHATEHYCVDPYECRICIEESEKEQNKMEKYNYKEVMKNDVLEVIKEHMEWEKVSAEDLDIDILRDYLWANDSVTGNGSGSYTMNGEKAKEYVLDNEELHVEVIKEFALDSEDIAKHLHDYEYWDVSIRCYLLDEVLQDVLEELQA